MTPDSWSQVMKDPWITTNELKIKHPSLLGEVSQWTIQIQIAKRSQYANSQACTQTTSNMMNGEKKLEFAKKYK